MKFRLARKSDAAALAGIYRHYVENTTVTFEYAAPDAEEFARRIEGISRDYPYIVCEEGKRITGYAYAHRVFMREAYKWDAELSVYVDKERLSDGIGTQLYERLIELLKLTGTVNVYAVITQPNEASEALHRRFGLKRMGLFEKSGYKFGRWIDVAWYGGHILPHNGETLPPVPFCTVSAEKIAQILDK